MVKTRLFLSVFYEGEPVVLTEAQWHHLRVLRIGVGDCVALVTPQEMLCFKIEAMSKTLLGHVVFRESVVSPVLDIHLVQSLPKGDKMGEIVQSCTEIGVRRFTPVVSLRSVSVPDPKGALHKQNRWQAIAESAAIQSRQIQCPQVGSVVNLSDFSVCPGDYDVQLVCWEEAPQTAILKHVLCKRGEGDPRGEGPLEKPLRVLVVIGPEGGFEKEEVARLVGLGLSCVSLGQTILRVEHAAFYVCAQLQYALRKIPA